MKQHTLARLVWLENYNCYSTRINNWLTLSFSWSEGAYRINVAGMYLPIKRDNPADAAEQAVTTARAWMSAALEKLS